MVFIHKNSMVSHRKQTLSLSKRTEKVFLLQGGRVGRKIMKVQQKQIMQPFFFTFSVLLERTNWHIWQSMWCSQGSVLRFSQCFMQGLPLKSMQWASTLPIWLASMDFWPRPPSFPSVPIRQTWPYWDRPGQPSTLWSAPSSSPLCWRGSSAMHLISAQ